jgi:hypothetical protein
MTMTTPGRATIPRYSTDDSALKEVRSCKTGCDGIWLNLHCIYQQQQWQHQLPCDNGNHIDMLSSISASSSLFRRPEGRQTSLATLSFMLRTITVRTGRANDFIQQAYAFVQDLRYFARLDLAGISARR